MVRPNFSSSWDQIPGFHEGKYVPLDVENWLIKQKIRERGKAQGEAGLPKPEDTQPDETHAKVLNWMNQRVLECKEQVTKHVTEVLGNLQSSYSEEQITIWQNLVHEKTRGTDTEMNKLGDEKRLELRHLREDLSKARKDLDNFRNANGLDRLPDEPSRFLSILVIIACALSEVVLNATLLQEVSVAGLAGSVAQMLLITAVNVLVGTFALGLGALRLRNSVHLPTKVFGYLTALLLVAMIGAFNMLVGHFRDSMLEKGLTISENVYALLADDTLSRFLSDPIGYDSFQSTLLVIVGLIFFFITGWKGYSLDDPYPGYSRKYKAVNNAESHYSHQISSAQDAIQESCNQSISFLDDILFQAETMRGEYWASSEAVRNIIEAFPERIRQYQNDCDTIIAAYREANLAAREEPVPRFFQTFPEVKLVELRKFELPPENSMNELIDEIKKAKERLQGLHGKILRDLQAFQKFDEPPPDADAIGVEA